MGQVSSTGVRVLKEFLRQRATVFWTIAWPSLWVFISAVSFASAIPEEIAALARGAFTMSMLLFALMIAGMGNLPASIAEDRERGLMAKLKSMPLRPINDLAGRILGLVGFSIVASIAVLAVGYACGGRLNLTVARAGAAIGFLSVAFLTSVGIGVTIGSLVKEVHGATMTGIGISVVTAALGGIFAPYSALPDFLKAFARVYPVSSANSSLIYILCREDLAGYNPITAGQVVWTVLASVAIFLVGVFLYSKLSWRSD